ncbi:MAG: beta-ketoacyl-[acyl-carrier-protein] synthase family protein [Acidiferrobacterales bacterium]
MSCRRVVITGLGVVSSIGLTAPVFADSLKRGVSSVYEIESFDTTGFSSKNGSEVRGFEPSRWVRNLNPRKIGRSSQFSIAAARMAVEDANLEPTRLAEGNCGVSVGTTDGESQPIDQLMLQWVEQGGNRMDPELILQIPADRLSVTVAQEFGLPGEAITISTACAAGNYAIGHAYDLICLGEADFMLCGGADSVCRKTFAGFSRLGAIAPLACQPFDVNRRGIITGEGSGMLLLESLDSAIARGARIYAEILGYGITCDAVHMVAPDPASIAHCMRLAHANAGIEPSEVDYVCAHGTGTPTNDVVEAAAIRQVFGEHPPPTSSIKSMIGHTMGAASALAAVACTLALHQGFIPPTVNSQNPDPECGLDCVPNMARNAALNIVQNNAFAFGGNNSIVIFRKTL